MEAITERFISVYRHLANEKNISNGKEFAETIGISPQLLTEITKGRNEVGLKAIQNTLLTYDFINPNWLLNGKGEMGLSTNPQLTSITPNNSTYLKEHGIPLIPVEAMAGIRNGGDYQVAETEIEDYFIVPSLKGIANCAFPVRGDSMAHKYCSGDFVMCKKIFLDTDFIQWNKPYVLDTTQGSMLKRIIKGKNKNSLICRSDNTAYDDFEIPITEIRNMAIVLAVIRIE
jgi:repressor LexA